MPFQHENCENTWSELLGTGPDMYALLTHTYCGCYRHLSSKIECYSLEDSEEPLTTEAASTILWVPRDLGNSYNDKKREHEQFSILELAYSEFLHNAAKSRLGFDALGLSS